jgi:uncharacterized protein (UPF0261 family)
VRDCAGGASTCIIRTGPTEGSPVHDQAGYDRFLATLKRHLRSGLPLHKADAHINDATFVDACVKLLAKFMNESGA